MKKTKQTISPCRCGSTEIALRGNSQFRVWYHQCLTCGIASATGKTQNKAWINWHALMNPTPIQAHAQDFIDATDAFLAAEAEYGLNESKRNEQLYLQAIDKLRQCRNSLARLLAEKKGAKG